MVLDELPGLYGFKYDSATTCGLPLYLYSYKLVGSTTFSVNSILATVLFDSGASHSFISQAFVRMHNIPLCAMKDPILVNSLAVACQLLIAVPQLVFL